MTLVSDYLLFQTAGSGELRSGVPAVYYSGYYGV